MKSVSYWEYAHKCWFNPSSHTEEELDLCSDDEFEDVIMVKDKKKNNNWLMTIFGTIGIMTGIFCTVKDIKTKKEIDAFYQLE